MTVHPRPHRGPSVLAHESSPRRVPAPRTRGMVTFELAIGILSAAIVTVILCWTVGLMTLHVRCADAAAQIARYTARGDDAGASDARARAPTGARVDVSQDAATVTVVVSASSRLGRIGPITMTGRATVPKEPS